MHAVNATCALRHELRLDILNSLGRIFSTAHFEMSKILLSFVLLLSLQLITTFKLQSQKVIWWIGGGDQTKSSGLIQDDHVEIVYLVPISRWPDKYIIGLIKLLALSRKHGPTFTNGTYIHNFFRSRTSQIICCLILLPFTM